MATAREAADEVFTALVEQYHADLMRLAFGMCGDRELAEDAVQRAWQNAWQAHATVRDWARVRGWLFTLTANEVRRQLRQRRLRRLLPGRLPHDERLAQSEPRDLDLEFALHQLRVRDRQLVTMRFALGMTSDEIAPYVGLSPSGTRVRLQRVLRDLRRELQE